MANFPINPGISSIFTDTTSGFRYKWTGTVWKSFTPSAGNDVKKLDDISSGFDNSTTTFALTFSAVAVIPVNAQSLTVSLGGVVQEPGTDYTVSGSNITFTTAPNSGLDFFAINRATATDIITKTGVLDNLFVSGMSTQSSIQATNLNVSGVSTFSTISQLNVSGVSTLSQLNVSGVITATGGVKGIGISSAGTSITTDTIQTLNFVGAGNTFKVTGTTVDISISGGGESGLSTTGISTGFIFSNPQFVNESVSLTNLNHNYGMFGPISISIGATITVGLGNTFVVIWGKKCQE